MSSNSTCEVTSESGNRNLVDEKVIKEEKMEIHSDEFIKYIDQNLSETTVSADTVASIKSFYCKLDDAKNNYELLSIGLKKDLRKQILKCEALEQSRSSLRSTIKKASANWSERKAQLSEGDSDNSSDEANYPKELLSDEEKLLNCDQEIDICVELKYKNEQFELSKRRTEDLNKRLRVYEKVIDDQETIIHGLKEQLDTYFTDNQKMSKQLAELNKLFQEIEASNCQEVSTQNAATSISDSADSIPSKKEYQAMSKSVSKTYIKLKELIYEKKSLVIEIERLNTLNVELQLRVSQQENRLVSVSEALQATWLIVSNLKDEHAKIHTEECILRYELKGKRDILHKLREELEWAREQWHIIRKMNSESEDEWTSLRKELDDRRNSDEIKIDKHNELAEQPIMDRESSFEPPIDLLLDMGIEYGVVDADDEEPLTGIALLHGEDVHNERLRDLEDQCCYLYQKLMTSTTRALALASRLTSLHEHYSASDEEEDDEEDQEEDDNLFEDNNNDIYEPSIASQDSESNDTAYVSEADGAESTDHSTSVANIKECTLQNEATCYGSSPEDSCDVLSKRLINFLPKKIEILSKENKYLVTKLQNLQEEKEKSEACLKATIDFELRQRRKLNEQLSHLGKCVDELKLERNGKIEKAEAELQRKIEEIDMEHKEHKQVTEELESLREKYTERGEILQLTALQLEQAVNRAVTGEDSLRKFKIELNSLQEEINQLKESPYVCMNNGNAPENSTRVQVQYTPNTEFAEIAFGADDKSLPSIEVGQEVASPSEVNGAQGLSRVVFAFTPQVVLSKDAIFTLPFHLMPDKILHWTISILSQEITFGLTYVAYSKNQADNLQANELHLDATRLHVDDNSAIHLISPVVLQSLESTYRGKLIPKISGSYCLHFKNLSSSSQIIRYQVWVQNHKDD